MTESCADFMMKFLGLGGKPLRGQCCVPGCSHAPDGLGVMHGLDYYGICAGHHDQAYARWRGRSVRIDPGRQPAVPSDSKSDILAGLRHWHKLEALCDSLASEISEHEAQTAELRKQLQGARIEANEWRDRILHSTGPAFSEATAVRCATGLGG